MKYSAKCECLKNNPLRFRCVVYENDVCLYCGKHVNPKKENPMTNDFKPGFYKCRDGSKAEIFAERGGRLFGIHENEAKIWAINGWLDEHGTPSVIDLISPWPIEPERVLGWCNLYHNAMSLFEYKQNADNAASLDRIDCRHITYTKGERKNEVECADIAHNEFIRGGYSTHSINQAFKTYLAAYRIGRVWDSSEEV